MFGFRIIRGPTRPETGLFAVLDVSSQPARESAFDELQIFRSPFARDDLIAPAFGAFKEL